MSEITTSADTVVSVDYRQVTAEHEAAHVIAYLTSGLPVWRVEIEPHALTQQAPAPVPTDPWKLGVVSIAGVVIEDRYVHRPLAERVAEAIEWVESEDPDESDDMTVFTVHPQFADAAYAVAVELLKTYKAEHTEITTALLQRDRLTAADLAALPLTGRLVQRIEPTD